MPYRLNTILHFPYPLTKTLMLVGMPGAGKTSIGSRLARIYDMPFVDGDAEVEKAGGSSCADLFARFGEAEFRRGEERVMERLLNGKRCILSSGGGAFLSEKTREIAKQRAITLFLDADVAVIVRNTAGRTHRPLLNTENPQQVIFDLMKDRRPVYETADIVLKYNTETLGQVLRRVVAAVNDYARR